METRAQRHLRRVLILLLVAVSLAIAAHLAILLGTRFEYLPGEHVATHVANLASGRGIYYNLDRPPYIYSTYMPVFYALAAGLSQLGLPVLHAGRLISFASFLGVVILSRKILEVYTTERSSRWAGILLVGSTANLLFWGTACRVDVAGVFFSLAAFYSYSRYRLEKRNRWLLAAGALVVVAVFTKQTMLAAGLAIAVLLARQDRRRALWFTLLIGTCGGALALALHHATQGGFFDNVIWANANPLRWHMFLTQAKYLILVGGSLMVMSAAGLRAAARDGGHPLLVYLATAAAVWLATCAKVGTDHNVLLELLVVLGLFAAWTLDRLEFFPLYRRGDRSWATLLHVPLLFYVVVNLALSGRLALLRWADEPIRRAGYAQLARHFQAHPGRVLSIELEPLLKAGLPVEVEPFVYRLMVESGRVDPEPVRRDLAAGRFSLVILYDDLSAGLPPERDLGSLTLPRVLLEEVRRSYRPAGRAPWPVLNGYYLYRPAAVDSPPAGSLE